MKELVYVVLVTCVLSSAVWSQDIGSNIGPLTGDLTRTQSRESDPEVGEDFVIGPEDVLRIEVWREPELSNPRVTVRADGKISLLLLDDVQASGLTPSQLKERITAGLAKFVNAPQVYVIPVEIHSQFVYITGTVAKPGVYALGSSMRITELLARAGGLGEFAKSEDIVVVRREGKVNIRFPFNYKNFVEGKDYPQDILLRRGDMVHVP